MTLTGEEIRNDNEDQDKDNEKSTGRAESNPWDRDWHAPPSGSNIDKILDFPAIDDMAGVLARAHFKDNRQRIAAVRLAHRNRKYNDIDHQNMLRDFCASTLGMGGLGKILQVQAGTNLLAPDMIRVAMGHSKSSKPEEVHRGGDFRERTENVKEVDNSSV